MNSTSNQQQSALLSLHFAGDLRFCRGLTVTPELLDMLKAGKTRQQQSVFRWADFSAAIFTGRADFTGIRFEGRADFIDCQFQGPVVFDLSTFTGPVNFDHSHFYHTAEIRRVTFTNKVSFKYAKFHALANFSESRFEGDPDPMPSFDEYDNDFTRATFAAESAFGGTFFKSNAGFVYARFKGLASFTDASFASIAKFYGAKFLREAHFHMTTFRSSTDFAESSFGSAVAFTQAGFDSSTRFGSATFRGKAEFRWSAFRSRVNFDGVKFKSGVDFSLVSLQEGASISNASLQGSDLTLDGASIERFLAMSIRTSRLSCRETQFLAGGHFSFEVPTLVDLEGAEFPAPFIISGLSKPANQPRILSLQRADVSELAMTGIDLTKCHFANAHGLDRLRMEGSVRFASPPNLGRLTNRKVLAEEQDWRARQKKSYGWSRVEWPEEIARPQRLEPHQIAPIYRSLRKGREDNKDEPGAADFYNGEMEMRRLDRRTPWAERVILWLYWLVSGYGLRGLRALASLALVVVGLAALLHLVGYSTRPSPASFWGSLLYAASSTLSIGDDQVRLTGWGKVLRITLRLAGPVLLGLTLLSVRNRVKG